jgi:photosystem II stability/assembly factor-like uncharacterized protein
MTMLNRQKSFPAWTLALALGVLSVSSLRAEEPLTLPHVHGLAYSADGRQLLIPSHLGLAVFAGGHWSKVAGPLHDYMGLSATRDALYGSGHPAAGSGLTNPFGLIKSRDGGKTWQPLGFTGESDFHTMATSYATNAVYVANREANSRIGRGIYYTLTDGLQWQRAAAQGLGHLLHSLAAHPTDAAVVAAGTDEGLYLSRDSARSFEPLVVGQVVIAESFDLDGQHLWFSTYAGKAGLARIALKPGSRPEEVQLPTQPDDAVAFIAQNPVRRAELAIATFQRNVFLSQDQGRTWTQIVKDGTAHE